GDVTQEARQVVVSLAAVNVVMGDLEGATEESAEALRDYYKALDEFDQRAGDAVEDAAERMV
ncbi:MAG: hypothetical protein GWN58_50800, partial [Anaerolineae bacterium]|nr:hypothetical protein [Anaerolineae bacterium]